METGAAAFKDLGSGLWLFADESATTKKLGPTLPHTSQLTVLHLLTTRCHENPS